MKKPVLVWFLTLPLAALFPSMLFAQNNRGAHAGATVASPSAFQKIVDEYYKIHDALANDTTEGIDAAAQKIAQLASEAQQKHPGKTPDFEAIKQAATSLRGKSLKPAREQFFQLSTPIIAELMRNKSVGKTAFAYKCTMVNKTWVQGEKEVRNPYFGKTMLKCGEPL